MRIPLIALTLLLLITLKFHRTGKQTDLLYKKCVYSTAQHYLWLSPMVDRQSTIFCIFRWLEGRELPSWGRKHWTWTVHMCSESWGVWRWLWLPRSVQMLWWLSLSYTTAEEVMRAGHLKYSSTGWEHQQKPWKMYLCVIIKNKIQMLFQTWPRICL